MMVRKIFLLIVVICMMAVGKAGAQQFGVAGFRMLPNDVSAFVNPVRDLNGEACALVKVIAPKEFAFSSPLGVVKRKDETGEIWLYLPAGSKMMTLKHPQWGVMRDYLFPKPLEGRATYEMRLRVPQKPSVMLKRDTVVLTKTVVDTVKVEVPGNSKKRVPLSYLLMPTVALYSGGPSEGMMFAMMRRFGFFVHGQWNFGLIGYTRLKSQRDGYIPSLNAVPYYYRYSRRSDYAITAGAIHRIGSLVCLFEGAGYGCTATAWPLDKSEGGGWVLNEGLTHKGLTAEAGLVFTIGRVSVSSSALTVAGKQWQYILGIGIKLGKR